MQVFWFIPTHGDGHYLGTSVGGRAITPAYLGQIAQAVDSLGFAGALLPTGRSCEDSWLVAAGLVPLTKRMKFLIAVRPGLIAPALAAQMASTLDRFSNGRLLINVVTGGDPVELAGEGIHLSHDERYAVTDEFLELFQRLVAGEHVTHEGPHFRITDGSILLPSAQQPHPPLFFGGSSPAGHSVAAKHADVYLTWGESPAAVEKKIADVKRRAAAEGRELRFGIRLHVIVRRTEEEAWHAANELISHVTDETIAAAQAILSRYDSHGQQRQQALNKGNRENLVVGPNLWAGPGLVRGGVGTALVGSPEHVAARMLEYAEIGIEHFIFSGYPALEEAYRTAELLFPLLPLSQPEEPALVGQHLVGEIVANDYRPQGR